MCEYKADHTDYHVTWEFDSKMDHVYFTMKGKLMPTMWMGIAFSQTGEWRNSDIIYAYRDERNNLQLRGANLLNQQTTDNKVTIDATQNVELLGYDTDSAGITTIMFRRTVAAQTVDDISLSADTGVCPYVLFPMTYGTLTKDDSGAWIPDDPAFYPHVLGPVCVETCPAKGQGLTNCKKNAKCEDAAGLVGEETLNNIVALEHCHHLCARDMACVAVQYNALTKDCVKSRRPCEFLQRSDLAPNTETYCEKEDARRCEYTRKDDSLKVSWNYIPAVNQYFFNVKAKVDLERYTGFGFHRDGSDTAGDYILARSDGNGFALTDTNGGANNGATPPVVDSLQNALRGKGMRNGEFLEYSFNRAAQNIDPNDVSLLNTEACPYITFIDEGGVLQNTNGNQLFGPWGRTTTIGPVCMDQCKPKRDFECAVGGCKWTGVSANSPARITTFERVFDRDTCEGLCTFDMNCASFVFNTANNDCALYKGVCAEGDEGTTTNEHYCVLSEVKKCGFVKKDGFNVRWNHNPVSGTSNFQYDAMEVDEGKFVALGFASSAAATSVDLIMAYLPRFNPTSDMTVIDGTWDLRSTNPLQSISADIGDKTRALARPRQSTTQINAWFLSRSHETTQHLQ